MGSKGKSKSWTDSCRLRVAPRPTTVCNRFLQGNNRWPTYLEIPFSLPRRPRSRTRGGRNQEPTDQQVRKGESPSCSLFGTASPRDQTTCRKEAAAASAPIVAAVAARGGGRRR